MPGIIPGPAKAIALLAVLPLSGLGVCLPLDIVYADDCIAAPNSTAPQGGHWYYRIDRAKKSKCWYLHPLNQSGQEPAAGDPSRVAPSVRLQSIDTQAESLPLPLIGAPISLTSADSVKAPRMLAVKRRPVTTAIWNADAEPSRQEGSAAPSTSEARGLQDASQGDGDASNPIRSAALDATSDGDVEGSVLESSPASAIPQAPILQKEAAQTDQSDAKIIGKSAAPAEEIGEAYARPIADARSSDTESTVEHIAFSHQSNISSMGSPAAMPTGETVAILLFGMALAGFLFGLRLMIVGGRRERGVDHRESNLIDDRKQLDGRESDLETALLANMMALAPPRGPKRSNVVRPFLS
jgi:hypothetical protein